MATMRTTLERWLLRYVKDAERIDLIHRGVDDPRVVCSYAAIRCRDAQGITDVVGELLAAAQDEADLADARCSFTISVVGEANRQIASTPIRNEPQRGRGDEVAPDEPSKSGIVAMLMEQNRFLHRVVSDAPARQRQVYEEIIETQAGIIKDQRTELAELYSALTDAGVEDADTRAQRALDEQKRSEALSKTLQDGLEMIAHVARKHFDLDDEDDPEPKGNSGEPIQ